MMTRMLKIKEPKVKPPELPSAYKTMEIAELKAKIDAIKSLISEEGNKGKDTGIYEEQVESLERLLRERGGRRPLERKAIKKQKTKKGTDLDPEGIWE